MNWTNYGGRGGRGGQGGRGGRGGRGGSWGYGQATNWIAQGGGGGGRGRGRGRWRNNNTGYPLPPPQNPFKRFDNTNYCWSCGWDVEPWHTSRTCPAHRQYAGHQEAADKNNTMGGTNTGKH